MNKAKIELHTIIANHRKEFEGVLVELVQKAFNAERPFLEFKLMTALTKGHNTLQQPNITNSQSPLNSEIVDDSWTAIESLSRLRRLVGGRFETLKSRWQACGFPLKAHRGEVLHMPDIDPVAWVALCAWIDSQGFLAKRSATFNEAFFWVKKKID